MVSVARRASNRSRRVLCLATQWPLVAHPGDPNKGIPSDPTNAAIVDDLGDVFIDIAYGGSCTASKVDDFEMYARVMSEAVAAGKKVADGVEFFIQFGSEATQRVAEERGWLDTFKAAGVTIINPGCGACIGCGPGVSETTEQVSVSAIEGKIASYTAGMWSAAAVGA
ncbi:MAG: hypothetical protein DHS20C15_12860 [Planctomycetota bacterium]|nr:MAG: hypothetical protein DHS20C15_12860 [Planctomycetota bacterium]